MRGLVVRFGKGIACEKVRVESVSLGAHPDRVILLGDQNRTVALLTELGILCRMVKNLNFELCPIRPLEVSLFHIFHTLPKRYMMD